MRVNWFSPLPPAPAAAAAYTAEVLPRLREWVEVVVWTSQEQWEPSLNNLVKIRHFQHQKVEAPDLNRADLTVYQLGNSARWHGSIWEVSRRHPGLVVLHDANLHPFFADWYRGHWQGRLEYLWQMQHFHGDAGLRDADRYLQGQLPLEYLAARYPLTSLAVQDALAVLVHAPELFETLKRLNHVPVLYTSLRDFRLVLRVLLAAQQLRPLRTAQALARRVADELSVWTTPAAGDVGLDRVAEEIQQAFGVIPPAGELARVIGSTTWRYDDYAAFLPTTAKSDAA